MTNSCRCYRREEQHIVDPSCTRKIPICYKKDQSGDTTDSDKALDPKCDNGPTEKLCKRMPVEDWTGDKELFPADMTLTSIR